MQKKLICIDWDGTLLDSASHFVNAAQSALHHLGRHDTSAKDIRALLGYGQEAILQHYFPDDIVSQKKFWDACIASYAQQKTIQLLDGAMDFIKRHQHHIIAIVTNKPADMLHKEIRILALEHLIHSTFSGDQFTFKPDPHMILAAMKHHNIAPEHSVMIGDSPCDQQAAHSAGIPFIAVHSAHWHPESIDIYRLFVDEFIELSGKTSATNVSIEPPD